MATEVLQVRPDKKFIHSGTITELDKLNPNSTANHSGISFGGQTPASTGTTGGLKLIAEETASNYYNLLDAAGVDWRDISNWSTSSNTRYDPDEDCLEYRGYVESTLNSAWLPIFHNKRLKMSCEYRTLANPENKNLYMGMRLLSSRTDAINGSPENNGGTYTYNLVAGNIFPSTNEWTYVESIARTGITGLTQNQSWYSDAPKWFGFLILANYSGATSANITQLRNIRIWYEDEETDKPIPDAGFGVNLTNRSTNNLSSGFLVDQTFRSGHDNAVLSKFYTPNGEEGSRVKALENVGGSAPYRIISSTMPCADNIEYNVSFILKTQDLDKLTANFLYIRQHNSSNTLINTEGIFSPSSAIHLGDNRYLMHSTFRGVSTSSYFQIYSYLYYSNVEFEISNLNVHTNIDNVQEMSLLPASAVGVDYHRTMTIPVFGGSFDFTAIGSFIQTQEIFENGDASINSGSLFGMEDENGDNVWFRGWHYSTNNETLPYIDPDIGTEWNNTVSNVHTHNKIVMKKGLHHWVFRKWDSGAYRVTIFDKDFNKLLESTVSSVDAGNALVNKIKLGVAEGSGNNIWPAIHTDIQFYQDIIDDAQIKEIVNTRMSISSDNVIDNISETLIPKDFISVDMVNDLIPTDLDTVVEFDNGVASIKESQNILGSDILNEWNGLSSLGSDLPEEIYTPYGKAIKTENKHLTLINSSNKRYNQPYDTHNVVSGAYTSYSAWVYVSEDCNLEEVFLYYSHDDKRGAGHYDLTKKGRWQYVKIQNSHMSTQTSSRLFAYNRMSDDTTVMTGYVLWANVCGYESLPAQGIASNSLHANSINGLTPKTLLRYNLNETYGLDWSQDWTIIYDKFPIGTNQTGQADYSWDSIGSNNSGVAVNYAWWGKDLGGNIHHGGNIINDEYFRTWRTIMVSYDSANGNLNFYEKSEHGSWVNANETTGRGTAIANATDVVASIGADTFDLQLGTFWNGDDINMTGIYKNLMISQTRMTGADFDAYYREKMRIVPNGPLQLLNGDVIEGEI